MFVLFVITTVMKRKEPGENGPVAEKGVHRFRIRRETREGHGLGWKLVVVDIVIPMPVTVTIDVTIAIDVYIAIAIVHYRC